MKPKLKLNDKITNEQKEKILISDIAHDKSEIFKYIKQGLIFDDEVLELCGIKKQIRDIKTDFEFCEKKQSKKEYPKETESLKRVLNSILTLNNVNENTFNQEDVNE